LDKRLDLDIDEILDTPKLRIKLSPAELDKQLLELYDTISESPGGDVLRILGGGGQIGLQNLYLKRHAERERWKTLQAANTNGTTTTGTNNKFGRLTNKTILMSFLPSFTTLDDSYIKDEMFQQQQERTTSAAQWVRYSLRKNQIKLARSLNFGTTTTTSSSSSLKQRQVTDETAPDINDGDDNTLTMTIIKDDINDIDDDDTVTNIGQMQTLLTTNPIKKSPTALDIYSMKRHSFCFTKYMYM
jgi:hypothetical protein